jgi:maltose O-acetyltransferase
MLKDDLRRWPFYFFVNVLLASPLVPRAVRACLLRATGMQLETYKVYPRCFFGTAKLKVGRHSLIGYGVQFDNEAWVELGDYVGVGMRVTFVTSTHDVGPSECRAGKLAFTPISVGNGAWIGAGAIILRGVTIGEGCIIAAGSVVTSDCAPNTMYGGVPARPIRELPTTVRELPTNVRELPTNVRELPTTDSAAPGKLAA